MILETGRTPNQLISWMWAHRFCSCTIEASSVVNTKNNHCSFWIWLKLGRFPHTTWSLFPCFFLIKAQIEASGTQKTKSKHTDGETAPQPDCLTKSKMHRYCFIQACRKLCIQIKSNICHNISIPYFKSFLLFSIPSNKGS